MHRSYPETNLLKDQDKPCSTLQNSCSFQTEPGYSSAMTIPANFSTEVKKACMKKKKPKPKPNTNQQNKTQTIKTKHKPTKSEHFLSKEINVRVFVSAQSHQC